MYCRIGILIFISACTLKANGYVVSQAELEEKASENKMLESLLDAIMMKSNTKSGKRYISITHRS